MKIGAEKKTNEYVNNAKEIDQNSIVIEFLAVNL